MFINYYKVLGIDYNSTIEEIKRAYRINAIKYHPDKTSGDPDITNKFLEIQKAYSILSNLEERVKFDNQLNNLNLVTNTVENKEEPVIVNIKGVRLWTFFFSPQLIMRLFLLNK